MRHGSKKIKLKLGKDANKMVMRKLVVNFIKAGKITTTEKKAKLLKMYLERLLEKSKAVSESNKNYLLSVLADNKLVQMLFESVGPTISDRTGGYIKMQKLNQRESDGALMVKLEWTSPVVIEQPKKIVKEKTSEEVSAPEVKK